MPALAPLATPSDGTPASPLLERQLERLERMADVGQEVADALARQARGEGPPVTDGDVVLAYARVSRAVRMAILLQSKLVGEVEARQAIARQALTDAKAAADQVRAEQQERRKCRISWIVERVAEAGRDDKAEVDRLTREADERLDDDGLIGDVLSRPTSEIVARICKDLGLDPDWTRLAEEAWAQEEIESGTAGSPLLAMPRAALAEGESRRASAPNRAESLFSDTG